MRSSASASHAACRQRSCSSVSHRLSLASTRLYHDCGLCITGACQPTLCKILCPLRAIKGFNRGPAPAIAAHRLKRLVLTRTNERRPMHAMSTTEIFLIAMAIIFTLPYLVWRLSDIDYYAPLVWFRSLRHPARAGGSRQVFSRLLHVRVHRTGHPVAERHRLVGGHGVRVDRRHRTRPAQAWKHRRETASPPAWRLACRSCSAPRGDGMLAYPAGSVRRRNWQFIIGVGMACAVTALPILILLMEKLEVLRQPIGSACCATRASTTSPSGACSR